MLRMLQALRDRPLPESLLRIREQRGNRERQLTAHAAATDICLWLASVGCDGWVTSVEVDDAWAVRREMLGAAPIPSAEVREALRGVAGVRYSDRKRLAGAEFSELRSRLRAMGRSNDRCCVYYIPKLPEDMEIDGCPPSAHVMPGHCPGGARDASHGAGQEAGTARAEGGRWPGMAKIFGGRAA